MNTVALPVPPSVNKIWRVVRIRNKARITLSAAYRDWRDVAVLLLRTGLDRVKVYPVAVRVVVVPGKGWRNGRDIDNLLKAVLDALVKAERIADDDGEHVTRCSVEFGAGEPEACIRVTVEAVP